MIFNRSSILHFIAILVFALQAAADPASRTAEVSFDNIVTASQYTANGEQVDLHLPFHLADFETYFENLNGQTGGAQFNFVHLKESVSFGAVETLQTRFSLGLANLHLADSSDTQFLDTEIELRRSFGEKFEVFAKFGASEYADLFQTQGAFAESLKGESLKAGLNWRPIHKLRAQVYHQSYWLSDSNNRLDDDFSLLYALSPDWPWIWIGAGFENITDTLATSAYWSPKHFIDYGPRFDVAFPIFEKLTGSFGLNINHYKDFDFGEGNGFYFLGRLTYGQENHMKLDLSWEQIQSKQEANNWFSQMIRIGLTCPF